MGLLTDLYGDREDAKYLLSILKDDEGSADDVTRFDKQLDRHNFNASRFTDSMLAGLDITLPFTTVPTQIRSAVTYMMAGSFKEAKSDHYSDDAPIERHHPWWLQGREMVAAYAQQVQSSDEDLDATFDRAISPDEC